MKEWKEKKGQKDRRKEGWKEGGEGRRGGRKEDGQGRQEDYQGRQEGKLPRKDTKERYMKEGYQGR